MEIVLIICVTVVVLAVLGIWLYLFTRPFEDIVVDAFNLIDPRTGAQYRTVYTIERTYKNGQKKLVTKIVNY